MKKLTKALLMLAVAVTVIFASASIASAATIQAAQIGCEDNSITISIPNTGSGVDYYDIYNITTDQYIVTGIPASMNSYTFTNLEPGVTAYIRIEGWKNGSTYRTDYASLYVNTTPEKLSKSDFVVSSVGDGYCYVQTNKPSAASGCEVQIKKVSNGSTVASDQFYSYSDKLIIKNNTAYKYRTRTYYTNSTTKETYYSPWSSYRYFDNVTAKIAYSSAYNGCKVSIKGVSKVSKYKIYVSKSYDSGYKLTKTVKPSVGKTVTYKINKIGSNTMKKGTSYYVKIVPVISGDHTSEIFGRTSFYNTYY